MRFDNRHIFSGKINGKSLSDLRQLDYKTTDLESRKQIIEDLIDSTRDEKGLTFFLIDKHFQLENCKKKYRNYPIFFSSSSNFWYLI